MRVHLPAQGIFTSSSHDLRPRTKFYSLATADSIKQLKQEHLVLQVGQTARVDGTLQVGATSQSVDVEATVPLVNTETAARGDVIAPAELTQMPLNGRDFNDLAIIDEKPQGGVVLGRNSFSRRWVERFCGQGGANFVCRSFQIRWQAGAV